MSSFYHCPPNQSSLWRANRYQFLEYIFLEILYTETSKSICLCTSQMQAYEALPAPCHFGILFLKHHPAQNTLIDFSCLQNKAQPLPGAKHPSRSNSPNEHCLPAQCSLSPLPSPPPPHPRCQPRQISRPVSLAPVSSQSEDIRFFLLLVKIISVFKDSSACHFCCAAFSRFLSHVHCFHL